MLVLDSQGYVNNRDIRRAIRHGIERGPMPVVQGIIVHQTNSATARATLNGYDLPNSNGAHFLIDKDGTTYQTASLFKQTWHVGKIKSLCYEKRTCQPVEMLTIAGFRKIRSSSLAATLESNHELKKPAADRYPSNSDSIGIELVGLANRIDAKGESAYEPVSEIQNTSLKRLVRELEQTLKVNSQRIFKHPLVSRKRETEAATADWQ